MQPLISVIPSDERMVHLANYLQEKGAKMCDNLSAIADSGLVLCATPFTKDGVHLNTTLDPAPTIANFLDRLTPSHTLIGGGLPSSVTFFCVQHGIPHYDLLSCENLALQNARLTAEGLLISLLSHTNNSICKMVPLIVGYGRCGKEIADILNYFIEEIYIYDINENAQKEADTRYFSPLSVKEIQNKHSCVSHINTIINTAPTNPFSPQTWQCFEPDCLVFQVASGELSLPFPLQNRCIVCHGIPGSYAPKTAGICMAKEICRHFRFS
nr:hypothetical protein [Eubacterium sp.]